MHRVRAHACASMGAPSCAQPAPRNTPLIQVPLNLTAASHRRRGIPSRAGEHPSPTNRPLHSAVRWTSPGHHSSDRRLPFTHKPETARKSGRGTSACTGVHAHACRAHGSHRGACTRITGVHAHACRAHGSRGLKDLCLPDGYVAALDAGHLHVHKAAQGVRPLSTRAAQHARSE